MTEDADRKSQVEKSVRKQEREQATRDILNVISQSRDDEGPVFDVILDNAERLCSASGSGLMLANDERTHLTLHRIGPRLDKGTFPLGFKIGMNEPLAMCAAVREGVVQHIADLKKTDLYRAGHEGRRRLVDDAGVRANLSVPLMRDGIAFGSISLTRQEPEPFLPEEVKLVETFAAQAVIAIDNVHQFRALEALNAELEERVKEQVAHVERMGRLKRFLPSAVADTIISSGSEKMLSSHRALLGVLFCDIRGFTAFCETAEPEETIEVLQTYHKEMGKLINAHSVGVDLRMGDGIMALFNDPLPCDDPAGNAVRLAIAMRTRMTDLCQTWKRMGHRLGFGVGISLGYATVGMVGYEGRSDYTASGTAINVGSRLCELAEDGAILLSARAAIAVEENFPSVSVGKVTLKGIRDPVDVFRLANNHSA
ncbi:adenylate/guanylate cyclase domain-containing protein [Tropicibacter sp. Alg240-R139]|uniref:adenylate/guanylate cyclase domain-containing protein n=1 Tax=Tropicibacter sp. Alg240-R139 TaxID=2305991 RepID=UPI0013E076B2|nr:adenylate/guanylate cyclase domain-containing protein [Tropicibacter sp. Alg240-R139]